MAEMIAVDGQRHLFYEGSSFYGHAVWPTPILSIATVVDTDDKIGHVPDQFKMETADMLFREDFFDPVTRIRRGRFYRNVATTQPHQWHVQRHPAFSREAAVQTDKGGFLMKDLCGFQSWPARTHLLANQDHLRVVLGIKSAMTFWKVVGVEHISTGEDLVTLKSLATMGVLPEINFDRISEQHRSRISDVMNRVLDAAYRAGPESVVDRCRDLATATLGVWLESEHPTAINRDIGDLAKIAREKEKYMVEHAVTLIGRLHARGKPNEQAKRSTPPLQEDDAALALHCTNLILRDIGLAASGG